MQRADEVTDTKWGRWAIEKHLRSALIWTAFEHSFVHVAFVNEQWQTGKQLPCKVTCTWTAGEI